MITITKKYCTHLIGNVCYETLYIQLGWTTLLAWSISTLQASKNENNMPSKSVSINSRV